MCCVRRSTSRRQPRRDVVRREEQGLRAAVRPSATRPKATAKYRLFYPTVIRYTITAFNTVQVFAEENNVIFSLLRRRWLMQCSQT